MKYLLEYQEFLYLLNEGKKDELYQTFVVKHLLPEDTFNSIINNVPGGQNNFGKYAGKMLEFALKNNITPDEIIQKFGELDTLIKNKALVGKDTDAFSYKTFDDIKNTISQNISKLVSKNAKKKKSRSLENLLVKVYQDDDHYQITQPMDWNASKILAYGADWCISRQKTNRHWYGYILRRSNVYFIFDKTKSPTDPSRNIAVIVTKDDQFEITDSKNSILPLYIGNSAKEHLKKIGIDPKQFHRMSEDEFKEFEKSNPELKEMSKFKQIILKYANHKTYIPLCIVLGGSAIVFLLMMWYMKEKNKQKYNGLTKEQEFTIDNYYNFLFKHVDNLDIEELFLAISADANCIELLNKIDGAKNDDEKLQYIHQFDILARKKLDANLQQKLIKAQNDIDNLNYK